jgi:CheY-like chemotaxis protein
MRNLGRALWPAIPGTTAGTVEPSEWRAIFAQPLTAAFLASGISRLVLPDPIGSAGAWAVGLAVYGLMVAGGVIFYRGEGAGPGDDPAVPRRPLALVVEDHGEMRDLLSRALEASGWDVVRAINASTAHRFLMLFAFDCVVLDLMLPDARGEDVIRWARLRPEPPRVVVVSGVGDGSPRLAAARKLGADAVLVKGNYRVEDLVAAMTGGPVGKNEDTEDRP